MEPPDRAANGRLRRLSDSTATGFGFEDGAASITVVILAAMKTAVSIPDDVFEQADRLAGELRVSRSELYATALRSY